MTYKTIMTACIAMALAACASSIDTKYSYQMCCGMAGYVPTLYSKTVRLSYPGPVLPLEDVGIVSYNSDLIVQVKDSDGNIVKNYQTYGKKGLSAAGVHQQHFLPGVYTFIFGYYRNDSTSAGKMYSYSVSRSTSNIEKTVTIKKGDIIHFTYVTRDHHWAIVEKDDSAERNKIKADYEEAIKLPINE